MYCAVISALTILPESVVRVSLYCTPLAGTPAFLLNPSISGLLELTVAKLLIKHSDRFLNTIFKFYLELFKLPVEDIIQDYYRNKMAMVNDILHFFCYQRQLQSFYCN